MSDTTEQQTTVTLAYYTGVDDPASGVFTTRPVDPEFTHELRMAVYVDDDSTGFPEELRGKPLQIQLVGTARALEAFGTYLLALGRLQSPDPDPHEHFDDVRDERGGTVHLIVRRSTNP